MDIFLQLLVLLLLSRACGELAVRHGQPALVGELGAGVALGLIVGYPLAGLPIVSDIARSQGVELVANLGVFFLILYAGVEMRPSELKRRSRLSFVVASGGALLPLAAGLAFGWAVLPASEVRLAQALLIGVSLSITAVPVTIRVFMDLRLLHHVVGRTVVTAAIFDDVIGLVLLALLTAVILTGSMPDAGTVLLLLLKVVVFLAVSVYAGRAFYVWISRMLGRTRSAATGFSALVVTGLAFAVLAELLGMHFILGAFVAGLHFEKATVGRHVYRETRHAIALMTNGFLAPVFFATIGLELDLAAVVAVPGFLVLLILLAFLCKLLGAGLPARLAGLNWAEATAVGVGMSGRGVISLVVVSVAFESGLLLPAGAAPVVANLFSALVITIVATTVATPVLLRLLAPRIRARPRGELPS